MFEYKAKVLRTVDGDTLKVSVDLGFSVFVEQTIRIEGIDTPEVYGIKKESPEYLEGKAASDFTKQWVEQTNENIIIQTSKTGKYGRYIARVFADVNGEKGDNLAEALLASGHAVLYE